MEFKITKQEKNALFEREEVTFTATGTAATPTREEVKKLVSAKTGNMPNNIAIISINSEFGKNVARGIVHIYKSKEDLEKREPKYIVKRNTPKPKEDKPKEAAPVAPVEEAAPAEPKAEEQPTEEKKKEGEE
jgi:small subunit ribosomal protein S24e